MERKIMEPYSEIKMRTKREDPYSRLKPETNSDSDSLKSNGVRLDSANEDRPQSSARGRRGRAIGVCTWVVMWSERLKPGEIITTEMKRITMLTS